MSGIARAVSRVFTGMRRIGFAAAALGLLFAAVPARAQLVPITRCNSAIPCNIPYGLRPADAAAWTPGNNLGQGNTGMSVSTDFTNGIVPKIDRPPISEDPVEAAARMYVRKYPSAPGSMAKAPAPTGAAPKAAASASRPATPETAKPAPTPAPQP